MFALLETTVSYKKGKERLFDLILCYYKITVVIYIQYSPNSKHHQHDRQSSGEEAEMGVKLKATKFRFYWYPFLEIGSLVFEKSCFHKLVKSKNLELLDC